MKTHTGKAQNIKKVEKIKFLKVKELTEKVRSNHNPTIKSLAMTAAVLLIMGGLLMLDCIYSQAYIPASYTLEEKYIGFSEFNVLDSFFISSSLSILLAVILIIVAKVLAIKRDKEIEDIKSRYK